MHCFSININKVMNNLYKYASINKIYTKKFIPGEEYVCVEDGFTGIFLGKTNYYSVFIVTYSSVKEENDCFRSASRNWGDIYEDGFYIDRDFYPLYKKYKDKILNLSQLEYRRIRKKLHNDYKVIHIGTSPLFSYNLSKPVLSDIFKQTLINIKKDSNKKDSNYKIANHLLSNLSTEICQINEIGIITINNNQKNSTVLTFNKSKALKSIKKIEKNTAESITNILVANLEENRLGKVIKKMCGYLFSDDKIGIFLNAFNAKVLDTSFITIKVVKGKDIAFWYNGETYTKEKEGELQKSCMRQLTYEQQWNFYANLPSCEMIIVTVNNKLHARALWWTLNTGEKYLDRIYFTNQFEKDILKQWAIKEGMKYCYDDMKKLKYTDTFNSLLVKCDLDLLIKNSPDVCFPYFDSVKAVTCDLKILIIEPSDVGEIIRPKICYELQSYDVNRMIINVKEFIELRQTMKELTYMPIRLKEGEINVYNLTTKKWQSRERNLSGAAFNEKEKRYEI